MYVADEVVLITRVVGVRKSCYVSFVTDYTYIQAENKSKGALRTLRS